MHNSRATRATARANSCRQARPHEISDRLSVSPLLALARTQADGRIDIVRKPFAGSSSSDLRAGGECGKRSPSNVNRRPS
eukprot:scaffold29538_cov120-Isochrysis_galbana.AAC.2